MPFSNFGSHTGLQRNYSLYAAPAGWVLAMAPLWWAIAKTESASPGAYNNALPLESWKNLDKKGIEPQLYRRIIRAVAANNNGHVNLAIFSGALAAANAAHVSVRVLHNCAIGFLVSRAIYNLTYIFIDNPKWSWFRSAAFWGGAISSMTLFCKAAGRYKALPW